MYHFTRRYIGPVQAIIMDWAGTTVDFGSMAPIRAFQNLFAEKPFSNLFFWILT